MAFGRKKEALEQAQEQVAPAPTHPKGYTPGKGAPTPKRKDVEARRRRPIISDKSSMTREEKKARKAEERARSSERWEREQTAMKTGDIRNMPLAHAGVQRAFARDALDSRFQFSSLMLFLAIIMIVGVFTLTRYPLVFNVFVITCYAVLVLMAVEAWWRARQVRTLVEYKFGEDKTPDRLVGQMMSRGFTPRRWRMPRPMVKFGEYPEGGTPADLKKAREAKKEAKRAAKG